MNYMLNCISAIRVKKEKRILYLFSVLRYKRRAALRLDAQKDLLCPYFMLLLMRLKILGVMWKNFLLLPRNAEVRC